MSYTETVSACLTLSSNRITTSGLLLFKINREVELAKVVPKLVVSIWINQNIMAVELLSDVHGTYKL